jgi:SAM-dependent methyltransferase
MNNLDVLSSIPVFLSGIFEKYGPDPDEYAGILEFIDQIEAEDIQELRQAMMPILNPGTIIGFSFTKPFGYNGDFFIIEKIYQHYISPDKRYKKWDEFFHTFPAAIAVVNRKKLAIEILKNLNNKIAENNSQVLILGSGPMSEVFDFMMEYPDSPLFFDLIDLDKRAIAYAKAKNKRFLSRMSFYNVNVIRHIPEKTYDLIWSAGLFDYFKDKHFVYLLKKYYEFVKPGGQMIIGNFNIENPSRRIMEILGDWFLNHRSEEELMRFALQAGIPKSNIKIIREPLGINLFLKVIK